MGVGGSLAGWVFWSHFLRPVNWVDELCFDIIKIGLRGICNGVIVLIPFLPTLPPSFLPPLSLYSVFFSSYVFLYSCFSLHLLLSTLYSLLLPRTSSSPYSSFSPQLSFFPLMRSSSPLFLYSLINLSLMRFRNCRTLQQKQQLKEPRNLITLTPIPKYRQ